MNMPPPVIIALTQDGAALAVKIKRAMPGAEVHGLEGRVTNADAGFAALGPHVLELFTSGRPIIGVCAAGILIRTLAPALGSKRAEPPVLCVAGDARAVVPLLGGHQGGNRLAATVAEAIGARAVITTAGDLGPGAALDDPPTGWRVGNPAAAKAVSAALLAGDPVALVNDLPGHVDWAWLDLPAGTEPGAGAAVRLSEQSAPENTKDLYLHPRTLALGVGCERGAPAADLSAAARHALADAGLSQHSVACVATIDIKEDEPAIRALARELDAPLVLFPAGRLEAETPRLANPSDYVFQVVGCHGVAEGAALAAAGADGELIAPKAAGKRVTCAIARAQGLLDPFAEGRPAGWLAVVGIGPGRGDWRAPEASTAIAQASDLVGYGLYLDLLGPLSDGKERHEFPLGKETERVDHALGLAATGKKVCLISSGDAGIYAMASLVFERMDHGGVEAWRRIETRVVPGISAMQAAAARAGAPLGHDFCAISLSDLMTPWPVIERRLRAAAAGDFVVALYNPISRRRQEYLERARDILLDARPPETPVILARNLGRADETVRTVDLSALTRADADMLTIIIVGNRETKRLAHGGGEWVYTPRGYADRPEDSP